MSKVSFDYDSTLSRMKVELYAKELIERGVDVYITTTRYENPSKYSFKGANHDDLYGTMKRLGLSKEKLTFTNFNDKVDYLDDYIWHLDDDEYELDLIKKKGNTIGIYSYDGNWKGKCNDLLK